MRTATLPRTATRTRTYAPTRALTPAKIQTMVNTAVADALTAAHADAKRTEDRRAAKRNRNRIYMLLVTIANTFLTVIIVNKLGYHHVLVAFPMLPIVVGLLLDMALACWSWWRKL